MERIGRIARIFGDRIVGGLRRVAAAVREQLRPAGNLLRDAGYGWYRRKTSRTAAAIAYYGIFSLAPLLVIAVGVADFWFGKDAAEGLIVDRLSETFGPEGAAFVQSLLARAHVSGATFLATVVAVAVLLFGASRVVGAVRDALNEVWGAKGRGGGGVKGLAVGKIFDLGMVLAVGGVFLTAMVANAFVSAFATRFTDLLPLPTWVLRMGSVAFSLAAVVVFITIVFRILPNVRVPWRDCLQGAAVTAVLFSIGNYVIGVYLGRASITSVFGAAGALAVLMIWMYYTAQIVLFGAEVTRAHHDRMRRRRDRG